MKKFPKLPPEITAKKKPKTPIADQDEMCEVCGRRPGTEIKLCPAEDEHHCNCCAVCANKCYALNEII